jgi:hypothetical protein
MPQSWPTRVDVLRIDDQAAGVRLARGQTTEAVASALVCRHYERSARETMAAGRGEVQHTDQFHFPADPAVTTAHVLSWTPVAASAPLLYRVKGDKRPTGRGMPWVVYAERIEIGPT